MTSQPEHDMVVDATEDYEMIDEKGLDEKQDVAIITPADSPSDAAMETTDTNGAQEEEPEDPLADEYSGMTAKYMPEISDLEIEAEGRFDWTIEEWSKLSKREHSPKFEVGGYPWSVQDPWSVVWRTCATY